MCDRNKATVSIIIPVKNEGLFIKSTIQSAINTKTNYSFEIIVVDDHSTDNCCHFLLSNNNPQIILVHPNKTGLVNARNQGASYAKGKYFIFCDAHLIFEDYWMDRLIEPIERGLADAVNPCITDAKYPNRMGFGYTWGENLRIKWNAGLPKLFPSSHLAGGCLAISKDVFYKVNQFDHGFHNWGYDDQELSLKLWLFGYTCYVQPRVKVLHYFRQNPPPYSLKTDDINYNFMRMAYLHFKNDRIEKCKRLIKDSNLDFIEELILSSDMIKLRDRYFAIRKYNDDWFMDRFNIPF